MEKVILNDLTLKELTNKLQELCHEGFAMSEVIVDIEGFSTAIIEKIEVVKESDRVLLKVAI